MICRRLLAPALLVSLLGGSGAFSLPILDLEVVADSYCKNPDYSDPIHVQLKPLADLIAKGEGDYNSVNRGWAGDTPQGIKGLTGSSFAGFTVRQVVDMQRSWLYAVGRYQFIPRTLRFAVDSSSVSYSDKFTPEAQDRLMAALVLYKRPIILSYLQGSHNDIGAALRALAREWASVEYSHGRGYYDHVGGNRAHITKAEASQVLQSIKKTWQDSGALP
jgi:hypothetical protein